MGLIVYRSAARDHHLPVPGALLAASGLFALLGIVAEYGPARPVATAAAWGFDIAAFLNVLPSGLAGPAPAKPAAQATGTTQKPGTTTAGGRG
jgi:hypothetical protein